MQNNPGVTYKNGQGVPKTAMRQTLLYENSGARACRVVYMNGEGVLGASRRKYGLMGMYTPKQIKGFMTAY